MKKQSRIRQAIILVIILLVLFIVGVSTVFVDRYMKKKNLASQIYGVWEEQNVPAYAQDIFVIREEGVYVAERVVDTRYTFDGNRLEYRYEGKKYIYKINNEESTILRRIAPEHYESLFYLRGKHQDQEGGETTVRH